MKKENLLVIAVVAIAIVVVGIMYGLNLMNVFPTVQQGKAVETPVPTSLQPTSDIAGRQSYSLVLNATLPNGVDSVLVYKTVQPNVTKDLTLAYAKKFNVTGQLRGDTSVQSDDLRYGITVTKKSGSVEYMDQDRPNKKMDSPSQLPSDEQAEQIAMKFLQERDLMPEGAEMVIPPDRENAYQLNDNGTTTTIYGEVDVWFHRTLNGLNVKGTQLEVEIGGNGDIIGYYANWRNYTPYKEYPIISAQDALVQLKQKGVPVGDFTPDRVSIDNVYLAYYTKAGAYQEDYLQPVWVFKGRVIQNDQSVMPVDQMIPALKEVPTELASSS